MAIRTKLTDLTPSREKYSKVIQLISNAYYAQEHFPNGMIKVFPWDSKVDEWIATRAQHGAGESVLFDLLPKLCNLNGLDPKKFLAGEVDLIVMVSRSLIRNSIIEYNAVCPKCNFSVIEKLVIPDQLEKIGEKPIDYIGYDKVILTESQDEVSIRPITVDDVLAVSSRKTNPVYKQFNISESVAKMLRGIVAVGGGSPDNTKEIITWYEALSPADKEQLIFDFNNIQPHLKQATNQQCDNCGHEYEHVLKLDEDFFRRGGLHEPAGNVEVKDASSIQEQGANNQLEGRARPDINSNARMARGVSKGRGSRA